MYKIILVTHDPGAMARLADRAMLIQQSKIMATGNPREVLVRYHQLVGRGLK